MDTARSVFQRRRKRISVWIIVFAIALTLATSLFSFFVKANGALMQDSDQVSESVNPPLAEDGVKTSDLDTGANVNNGWIALAVWLSSPWE